MDVSCERSVTMPRGSLGVRAAPYIAIRAGANRRRPRVPIFWPHARASARGDDKERAMSIGMIVLIIVVLMLVGVLPTWPHARSWGYGPSGIVGVILVIVLVLFLMGRI
jgi:hypothetical protein